MIRFIILAALAALPMLAAADSIEVPAPAVVSIPAGESQFNIGGAIRDALDARGWKVEDEKPGGITASVVGHHRAARIDVSYDMTQITITYRDSSGMDYRETDGKRLIDDHYGRWQMMLVKRITYNLSSEGHFGPGKLAAAGLEHAPQSTGAAPPEGGSESK